MKLSGDLTSRSHRVLLLILAGYLLLAVTYALATPPLEASDEYKHFPVVQYVQTRRSLPVLDPDDPGLWLQEGAQPPLYYIVMAASTAWIDTSDLEDIHQVNPHAFVGDPNQVDNKNLIIHQPGRESFPWGGTVLAVYVIRMLSIILGAGTIVVTYQLGSLLFNPTVGLLAAALTAFNPMFLFVNAAVNNDSLAILLGSVALYLLVRVWRDEPSPRTRWGPYALLGFVLGLGILTKLSVAGLVLLSGAVLALMSWRRRDWRFLVVGGGLIVLVALVLTAPWLLRNMREYGDPVALNAFIEVQGTRDSPITWGDWRGEFGTFYRSYWGLFGGVNVAAPEPFYWVYNVAALLGASGFLLWLWRRWRHRRTGHLFEPREPGESGSASSADTNRPSVAVEDAAGQAAMMQPSQAFNGAAHRGMWILVAWSLILLILLLRWNLISPAFQGRLLFPALGAVNVIWAVGLLALVPLSWRPKTATGLAMLGFILAALLPWIAIRPAYDYPQPVDSVPAGDRFGPITFRSDRDAIQLVGVEMLPGQSVTPAGEAIELVLYWKALQSVDVDYLSTVHLLGRDLISEGQVNRYPASGMVPTSAWKAGQIWRDIYHVPVDADAAAPARLQVKVGLYDTNSDQDLPAIGPDGEELEFLIVGEAKVAAKGLERVQPPVELEQAFNDGVIFRGYGIKPEPLYPGGEVEIDLYWEATGTPSLDYTVFVHLVDADGALLSTADGQPLSGNYPTSFWQEGERLVDRHIMTLPEDLPPGVYNLAVGLYDPLTLARMGFTSGGGDAITWPLEVQANP
jgi:hypothetical protein